MPHATPPTTKRRLANLREEGAVLIVVLMMLLSVSTTAVYTVNTATNELRGASAMRTSFQTESMAVSLVEGALAWVDEVGPATLQRHAQVQQAVWMSQGGSESLNLTNAEPVGLAPGQEATRLSLNDIASQSGSSSSAVLAIDPYSLNATTPSTPKGIIDVYDMHRYTGATPGGRSDGYGTLYYLRATYTGRALTELTNTTSAAQSIRDVHRNSATARAIATSGPFGGT